jgi:2,3-bisphosphoglycerate-dependent phosphoglycerate mutase
MKPLPPAEGKISQAHTSGIFLEKPGLLKEALKRSEEWDRVLPGAPDGRPAAKVPVRGSTLEESLLRLKEEQRAEERFAATVGDDASPLVDPNDDGRLIVTQTSAGAPLPATPTAEEGFDSAEVAATPAAGALTLNIQTADEASPGVVKQGESSDPVVVFVRHGRTPHNNLGLFTGWEDPHLAPDGVEDAKNAGRLLKMHGFKFDVVYTSWLTRAIETACELECGSVVKLVFFLHYICVRVS